LAGLLAGLFGWALWLGFLAELLGCLLTGLWVDFWLGFLAGLLGCLLAGLGIVGRLGPGATTQP
jgi:hypothetical protein